MTPRQRELARHALGLTRMGQQRSYRNHFVAGPDHTDYEEWTGMVSQGLATHRDGSPLSGGDDVFWLTRDGAVAALNDGECLCSEDFPEAGS